MTTYLEGSLDASHSLSYDVKLTDYNSFVILSESNKQSTFLVTLNREDNSQTYKVDVTPNRVNDLIFTGDIKSFQFKTTSVEPIHITLKPFNPKAKHVNNR